MSLSLIVSEEKFLHQLYLEEQFGVLPRSNEPPPPIEGKKKVTGAAIGYNYDDPAAAPIPPPPPETEPEESTSVNDENEENEDDSDLDFGIISSLIFSNSNYIFLKLKSN
jgi:arginine/serine-rich splicing factor 16